jgi:hypothetical protein
LTKNFAGGRSTYHNCRTCRSSDIDQSLPVSDLAPGPEPIQAQLLLQVLERVLELALAPHHAALCMTCLGFEVSRQALNVGETKMLTNSC